MKKRLIPYYRVSTDRQGASGLGLEAQVEAVGKYAANAGGTLLPAFQEIESGRRCDRPELTRALVEARRSKATLVVAKLDRLTRDTRFFLSLRDGRVPFVFCDLPEVPSGPLGEFFLTMMVAVAELERGLISQRTRAALAACKARGGQLGASLPGSHRFGDHERQRGCERAAEVCRAKGREFARDWEPLVAPLRGRGLTLRQIAQELNTAGHLTSQGRSWTAVQVRRVLLASQAENLTSERKAEDS
jgi:DNA invertase Pin-like site-specific DNA recombinase